MASAKVPVFLTFDVEDVVTEASDDAVQWIAELFSARGLPAAFFLTGDKARTLASRGRTDVVAALRPHDVGYHTDRHSVHPTISEYLADLGWADGVAEVVRRESAGADAVREVLGRHLCGFATPGTSWGPQVAAALPDLGLPALLHSFSRTEAGASPHWYAGALCLSRVEAIGPIEDSLGHPERFATLLAELPARVHAARERGGVVHLYVGHPTMFVNRQFWDAVNYADGVNPPGDRPLAVPEPRPAAETHAMLTDLATLLDRLAELSAVAEVVPFTEITRAAGAPPRTVPDGALAAAVRAARADPDITTDLDWVSPAELTYLLCLSAANVLRPDTVVPVVLGPVDPPDRPVAAPACLTRSAFGAAVLAVGAHVREHGALPSTVPTDGVPVPIAAIHRALVALGPDGLRAVPDLVTLPAGLEVPSVGDQIADHIRVRASRWLHHPELDVTRIARLARWQSWSLRAVTTPHEEGPR